MRNIKSLKVAIILDRMHYWGGDQYTAKVLLRLFPYAEFFTSSYDKLYVKKEFPDNKIHATYIHYLPFQKSLRQAYTIGEPIGFKMFNLKRFDVVISISSSFGKMVRIPKGVVHVAHILTPPVFIYQEDRRAIKTTGLAGWLYKYTYKGMLKLLLHKIFRYWDKLSVIQLGKYAFTNSITVAERCKKVYGVNLEVIYPPINTEQYDLVKDLQKEDFYLYLGRLEEYKGVQHAIVAVKELNQRLVIVGRGSYEVSLKELAKKIGADALVEFRGFVDDNEKFELYRKAKAFINPVRDEDFGITPVEAISVGTPVIGHRSGGMRETVSEVDPRVGVLFDDWSAEGVIAGIQELEKCSFKVEDMVKYSKKFSEAQFNNKFLEKIEDALQHTK